MSDNISVSPALAAGVRAPAPAKSLSFLEGVAMIVGTNIGAGVLSIAYASSKAGFLPLLFWLVLVGSLTTITMLYVAESTLRTCNNLLERLHASFFFYLMTGPGTFLQIGFYLPPAVILGISLTVMGLAQWTDAAWVSHHSEKGVLWGRRRRLEHLQPGQDVAWT